MQIYAPLTGGGGGGGGGEMKGNYKQVLRSTQHW
jgi:hypothetical protein